jgi:pre-mRNA branch site protein p14
VFKNLVTNKNYFDSINEEMNSQKLVNLPPEVNRILYVKNLPFKITSEEMYDIFGKFGAIR